jgi:autotransporter-associated beta strand protein
VISEFLASNHNGLKDQNSDSSDWIEIYNTTSASINMGGWYLTDKATNLTKWQVPNTSIPAHGFQVVFADGKNRAVAGQELHTNFSIDADGEYLALSRPDHTIATEFTPTFPPQTTDVSYGGIFTAAQASLIGLNAPAEALVPTNATLGTTWRSVGFNDSSWLSGTTGVGYDTDTNPATTYSGLIHLNVQSPMLNHNGSVYIRVPFNVANPSAFQTLTLRMKYDDGYVAWVNGVQIASKADPSLVGGTLAWNSNASANRDETQAVVYEDVTFTLPANLLVAGTNMLAIQGLNTTNNSSDLLIQPELIGNTLTYDGSAPGYFTTPTPGAVNGTAVQGIVVDTSFDHDHGFYSAPFQVVLSTPTAGTTIRYTTDGSTPTATTGTIYSTPITVSATTTLRAAAFRTGFASSAVGTETYIFLGDVVNQSPNDTPPGPGWPADRAVNNQKMDYGMDPDIVNSPIWGPQLQAALTAIPTISIVTDLSNLFDPTTGIYVNAVQDTIAWERPTSLELINPDGSDGFQINAGLRIRGGFSRSADNPKHAFRLFFRSDYGASNLDFPLFGDEGAQSFDKIDLRTAENYSWSFQNDSRFTMVNDTFSRDTQRDMGDPYERGNFYQLYINGQYWGVYETDERPEAAYAETYFGGDKSDYDVIKVAPDNGYTIYATDGVDPRNPDGTDNPNSAWTQLYQLANQIAATTDPTARFALYQQAQGLNPDYSPNPNYPVLLDVNNLADYELTIFYGGNLDAPISEFLGNESPNNWFGIRSRDPDARQGFQFFAHDSEHTLLDVNVNRLGPYDAGSAASGGVSKSSPGWIHQQLMAEPAYRAAFNLRANQMLLNGGPLTTGPALARYNALANELSTAIIGESARWGDVWKAAGEAPFTKDTWQAAIDSVKVGFIPNRTAIVLAQLQNAQRDSGGGVLVPAPLYDPNTPLAPVMSISQGRIVSGAQLSMTSPSGAGTIYFTTDGTDPMLPSGAVAPGALTYSGTITLSHTAHVFARVNNGALWSAYTDQVYATDASALRITEINYNPLPPAADSPYTADDFEYLELQNTSASPIDLLDVSFTSGITYRFTGGTLGPGQFAVLASNPTALLTRYPGLNIVGTYTGHLSDSSERLRLEDGIHTTILDFSYQDTWYDITDGDGYTLVTNNASGPATAWGQKESWRVSQFILGNPGAVDVGLLLHAVVINEVMANTTAATGDWIELRNTTTNSIDIGGWYLSNQSSALNKFQIPVGTTIAAGGYKVFNARDDFNNVANPHDLSPFTLSEISDSVFLTSIDGAGAFAGYREDVDFAGSASEVSFGRYVKSTGESDFVAMTTATPGGANAAPIIGPIVINELMYHPVPAGDEFLELYNISGSAVPLYDPAHPGNTWSLNDGISFAFPANQTLAAGAYALVVPIDPATFRSKYGISALVPIYGPYTGALANEGEKVRLSRPGTPVGATVPQISVDHVDYEIASPWPAEPGQGGGRTLSRFVSSNYGNDVANWRTSRANGGTPGALNVVADNTPPTVPSGVAATIVTFARNSIAWSASTDSDSGVGGYRVYRNGQLLATTTTNAYVDTDVVPGVSYSYTVSALNIDNYESAQSAAVTRQSVGIAYATDTNTTHITIVFSEPVTSATATNKNNYALSPLLTITSAALAADQKTVTLTTSTIGAGTKYKLSVSNIAAVSGNISPSGLQAYFTAGTVGTGLQGQYYDNIDFTALKITRTDATVNFNYGSGSPDPTIGADTFSVRWTGFVRPTTSETYTFYTVSDDGVRLYVNGQLLIANWTDHGPTEDSGSIALVAGQKYEIRMEFYENGGGAQAMLSWSSPSVAKAIIPQSALFRPATIAVADVSQSEGNSGLSYQEFVVSLSNPAGSDVTLAYTTSGGTATAGTDYVSTSGTLTIPAGVTARAIVVPVYGDNTFELTETFNLTLSSPSSFSFADSVAVGAISNDDPFPAISIGDISISEGDSGSTNAVFTVSLANPSYQQITVNFATANGTAVSPDDFSATSGVVTFNAGVTVMQVTIPVQGDVLNEANETFAVNLSSPTNATIFDNQGFGTIIDNDPLPTLSVGNVSVPEGDSGTTSAVFNVTLSTASGQTVTVAYGVSDGSATAGSDYTATSGVLTFAPGQTVKPVTINVQGDTAFEIDETFTFTLSNPTAATIGASSATGTIVNDDPPIAYVTNNSDSGDGSLRQALHDVADSHGLIHTIQFALPADEQLIDLITSLPDMADPLTAVLDSSQNVSVVSSSSAAWDGFASLTKSGAGVLSLGGASSVNGDIEVQAGWLRLSAPLTPEFAAGVAASVTGAATLELAGPVSNLTAAVNVANGSTAIAGVLVSGARQIAGRIDGVGSLAIAGGGDLTANRIVEGTLVIGGALGTPATLTIAASDAEGNPLFSAAAANSVASAVQAAFASVQIAPNVSDPPSAGETNVVEGSSPVASPIALMRSTQLEDAIDAILHYLDTDHSAPAARFSLNRRTSSDGAGSVAASETSQDSRDRSVAANMLGPFDAAFVSGEFTVDNRRWTASSGNERHRALDEPIPAGVVDDLLELLAI